jgi:uncharacterized coiled-coil protein SlyX
MIPYEKRLEWQSKRIAELEAEIATAKKLGAIEELEQLFHKSIYVEWATSGQGDRAVTLDKINERIVELRKEIECQQETK